MLLSHSEQLKIASLSRLFDCLNCAAYSPDGHHIITTSSDGTAKIWDTETFECLHTICNMTDKAIKP